MRAELIQILFTYFAHVIHSTISDNIHCSHTEWTNNSFQSNISVTISPVVQLVDGGDITNFKFDWNSIDPAYVSLNVAVSKSLMINKDLTCFPDISTININTINNITLVGNQTYNSISCLISIVAQSTIIAGSENIVLFTVKSRFRTGLSCTQFKTSFLNVPPIAVSIIADPNATSFLSAGEVFNLSVSLTIPEVRYDLWLSVFLEETTKNNVLGSSDTILDFPMDSIEYRFSSGEKKIISGNTTINKIVFHFGDLIRNVSNGLSYIAINFSIPIKIANNSRNVNGRSGNVIMDIGSSISRLPFVIVGRLIEPILNIQRYTSISNESKTDVHITINIKHKINSSSDAYNIIIREEYEGMVLSKVLSNGVVVNTSSTYTKTLVAAFIHYLPVHSEISFVYVMQFTRSSSVSSTTSRAEMKWQKQKTAGVIYGPIYSDTSCIIKSISYKKFWIPNYGFILLGIVCGIVAGVGLGLLFLLCVRGYPAGKKYIYHENETATVSDVERTTVTTIMSPVHYQDLEQRPRATKQQDGGFFNRIASSIRRKPTEFEAEGPIALFHDDGWRTDVIKGDIEIANTKINTLDEENCVTLLEFSLAMFRKSWLVIVQSEIESLHLNGELSLELIAEVYLDLEKILHLSVNSEVNDKISIENFIKSTSQQLLQLTNDSLQFYDGVLQNIECKVTKQPRNKSNIENPEIAKKQKTEKQEHETKIENYKKKLRNSFTKLFTTWLDCYHYSVGVMFIEKISDITEACCLVFYDQLLYQLCNWISTTITKNMDFLRRKRLLSNEVHREFREVFDEEWKEVTEYLDQAKQNLISKDVKTILLSNAEVNKRLANHYKRIVMKETGKSPPGKDEVKHKNVGQEVNEKFELCMEYTDVTNQSILECHENLTGIHEKLISLITKSLTVFLTRIQTHSSEVYRTKIEIPDIGTDTESLHAEPIEMRQASEVNHLEKVIRELKVTFQSLIGKLNFYEIERTALLKRERISFQDVFKNSTTKKKSILPDIITESTIRLKSILQSCGPTPWTNLVALLETAPIFSIESVLTRFLPVDVLLETNFKSYHDLMQEEYKGIQPHWPIVQKIEFMNEVNNRQTQNLYHVIKENLLKDPISAHRDEQIPEILKEHVNHLIEQQLEVESCEMMMKISNSFLKNVLTNPHYIVKENDGESIGVIQNFNKHVKSILKSSEVKITDEGETKLKEQLREKVSGYRDKCQMFSSSTEDNDFLSTTAFNIEEMVNHTFEMGKVYQLVHDKGNIVNRLYQQNIQFIRELWQTKVIKENDVLSFLKDIALHVSPPEFNAVGKQLYGADEEAAFEKVINWLASERELKSKNVADNSKKEDGVMDSVRKRKRSSKKKSPRNSNLSEV